MLTVETYTLPDGSKLEWQVGIGKRLYVKLDPFGWVTVDETDAYGMSHPIRVNSRADVASILAERFGVHRHELCDEPHDDTHIDALPDPEWLGKPHCATCGAVL